MCIQKLNPLHIDYAKNQRRKYLFSDKLYETLHNALSALNKSLIVFQLKVLIVLKSILFALREGSNRILFSFKLMLEIGIANRSVDNAKGNN